MSACWIVWKGRNNEPSHKPPHGAVGCTNTRCYLFRFIKENTNLISYQLCCARQTPADKGKVPTRFFQGHSSQERPCWYYRFSQHRAKPIIRLVWRIKLTMLIDLLLVADLRKSGLHRGVRVPERRYCTHRIGREILVGAYYQLGGA